MTDDQIITLAGYIVDGISPYLVALVAAVGLLVGCHLIDALNWWKW